MRAFYSDHFVLPLPEVSDPETLAKRVATAAETTGALRIKGFAAVKGKPVAEIRNLVRRFKHMMSIEEDDTNAAPIDESQPLGDLEALRGVVKFPVRIKCATLSWNTLLDALDQSN